MTNEELQAIKARCDAATPGPWIQTPFTHNNPYMSIRLRRQSDPRLYDVMRDMGWGKNRDNSIFIAHSRQDIPALLAHVEAQAARIKALEMRIQKESEERRMRV